MHEDKPVGYEAARWMIETELEGLYKICNPPEIAAGIYEYYLRAYLNPNHIPHRGETTVDMLETPLPYLIKCYGEDAVKAALRDLYNERFAREGRTL